MSFAEKMYKGIGSVSEWSGKAIMLAVPVLVLSISYDVFMRYVFNAPTDWSFCLSYMLGGAIVAIALPYVFYHDANVRIDIIYSRLRRKRKLAIDMFCALVFFFPTLFALVTVFGKDAWYSYLIKEVAMESTWYPLLWPFKFGVILGIALLGLQGIATFVRDTISLTKGGKEPW